MQKQEEEIASGVLKNPPYGVTCTIICRYKAPVTSTKNVRAQNLAADSCQYPDILQNNRIEPLDHRRTSVNAADGRHIADGILDPSRQLRCLQSNFVTSQMQLCSESLHCTTISPLGTSTMLRSACGAKSRNLAQDRTVSQMATLET